MANYSSSINQIVDINNSGRGRRAVGFLRAGIAEDIGFINELGYQIIKTAMGEFRHFSQRASLKDDFLLHINVSPWQLNEPHFHECFTTIMKENGLKANSLCVEITETVIERINEHFYLKTINHID